MAPRQRSLSSRPEDSYESTDSLLSEEQQKQRNSSKLGNAPASKPSLLNRTEADIARDRHDYFNLVALACIVATCGLNYSLPWLHYTGAHFWVMWGTTLAYFMLDLIWVAAVPICVKSPGVIIKHHLVAMCYIWGPIVYPDFRWLMGAILSIEINTWFLICRRLVYRNSYSGTPPSPMLKLAQKTVSMMFYISWLAIRCYLYPSILVMFYHMWVVRFNETGIYFHNELYFVLVHVALCTLNLKWTYDLFKPIVKRWLGTGPKQMVVQNGL